MDELKRTISKWISEGYSEGELSVDPGWYLLWDPGDIQDLNKSYRLSEYVPGLISFGSDGGGELLVVDPQERVYYLPAIGMEPEAAIKIAGSLQEFKSFMDK